MNDDDVITVAREQRDKVHSHTPVEQVISGAAWSAAGAGFPAWPERWPWSPRRPWP